VLTFEMPIRQIVQRSIFIATSPFSCSHSCFLTSPDYSGRGKAPTWDLLQAARE
jgi:hypothetical protein